MRVEGEEHFSPELFERARQLAWHYGDFSILNDRSQELKDRWFEENGETSGFVPGDVRATRILVLASRSLYIEKHTCSQGCEGLPESPFKL